MKTDFDKFRKWHHYQVASAVVMLTLAIADIIVSAFSGFSHISNRFGVVGLVLVATSFKIFSYSRCPHRGKSFMSKWLGRDSAGRNSPDELRNICQFFASIADKRLRLHEINWIIDRGL